MKKQIGLFSTAIITASILLFTSCKKDEETTPEVTVTFSITEPVAGTEFGLGDTVHMHVHITGSAELHGYEVNLINTSDGDTVVYENHLHDHGTSYSIEDFWVNDVDVHSDMVLQVKAFIDHDDNFKVKNVNFHCHPM